MKRDAATKAKFAWLRDRLGGSHYRTVGVLEGLWHFGATNAPAGDVGRFTDEQIESALGWDGEPGALIPALVETNWLDEHPQHRLVVHDWPQHCEYAVHRRIARARAFFANGEAPKTASLPPADRKDAEAFYAANQAPASSQKTTREQPTSNTRATRESLTSALPLPGPMPMPLPRPLPMPTPSPKRGAAGAAPGRRRRPRKPLTDPPEELAPEDHERVLSWAKDCLPQQLDQIDGWIEEALSYAAREGLQAACWAAFVRDNIRARENRRRERSGDPPVRSRAEARRLRAEVDRRRAEMKAT